MLRETQKNEVADSPTSSRSKLKPFDKIAPVIMQKYRDRRAWIKTRIKIENQAFAQCMAFAGDADEDDLEKRRKQAMKLLSKIKKEDFKGIESVLRARCIPMMHAIDLFNKEYITPVEKELITLIKPYPIAQWIEEEVFGVGLLSLACIIGEAGGPLSNYSSQSALIKRFGLAPYNGKSMATWRKFTNKKEGLSKEEWIEAGYNKHRRSDMWNVGNGLIGGMGKGYRPIVGEDLSKNKELQKKPYQLLFVEKLRYVAEQHSELDERPTRLKDVKKAKDGTMRESYSKHAANRARRYVEQQFLKDLYRKWGELM